jgi:hypothetical protein
VRLGGETPISNPASQLNALVDQRNEARPMVALRVISDLKRAGTPRAVALAQWLLREAQVDFLFNNRAFFATHFDFGFDDAQRSAVFGFGFGAVFKDFGDFERKEFFMLAIVFD